MSEARPSTPAGTEQVEMLARVEVAHRDVREVIERLVSATDLETIASGLRELPATLAAHFAEEEAPGGLYDGLRHRRPAVEAELSRLRGDHAVLAEQVKALAAQVGAASGGAATSDDLRSLQASTLAFAELLRGHERIESRLVAEIYYAEDGTSG
jgi:hypothetical protein